MNLIKHFSKVAGKDFTDLTEVRDYFIKKDFLELIGSTDLDFSIVLINFLNAESNHKTAPDTENFLSGLPAKFNSNHGNLATRINGARLFFLSSPNLDLDKTTGEIKFVGNKTKFNGRLAAKIKTLHYISSYVNNKILTEQGLHDLTEFSRTDGTTDDEFFKSDIEFNTCLLLMTISKTKREGKSRFSDEQFELLESKLKFFSGKSNISNCIIELDTAKDIDFEIHKYNKAAKGAKVENLIPLDKIYFKLNEAIENKNTAKTYNLCALIGAYRRYVLHSNMFTN